MRKGNKPFLVLLLLALVLGPAVYPQPTMSDKALANSVEPLMGIFSKSGYDGVVLDHIGEFEISFTGSLALKASNCSSLLQAAGNRIELQYFVGGLTATENISSLGLTNVRLDKGGITCKVVTGRFLQMVNWDFSQGSSNLPAQMQVNLVIDSVTQATTSVTFEWASPKPVVEVVTPLRGEEFRDSLTIKVNITKPSSYELTGMRLYTCDGICENGIGVIPGKNYTISGNGDFVRVLDERTIQIVPKVSGPRYIFLSYQFTNRSIPAYAGTTGPVGSSHVFGIPVTFTSAGSAKSQITEVSGYSLELNLKCPTTATKNKAITCSIQPTASLDNLVLEGDLSLDACLFSGGYALDCFDQYSGLVERKKLTATLGKKTTFTLKGTQTQYAQVLVKDPVSLAIATEEYFWSRTSNKKAITVRLTTSQSVIFGETHRFNVSTTPKISGTCKIYRFNLARYEVASVKLTNGRASGRHRWTWSTPGDVSLTLTAVCSSSKYEGTGYALVNGYRN